MTTHKDTASIIERLEAASGPDRDRRAVILTFPFGGPADGRVNYIGNGERDSVRVALKELLARWEGRYAGSETSQ